MRSVIQYVEHADLRVDLDGLSIQESGPVTPLANRSERRGIEERIAGHNFQRLNRAIRCNDGVKLHAAFAVHLQRQFRINRLHAMDQCGCFDVPKADARFLYWGQRFSRRLRTSAGSRDERGTRDVRSNRRAWNPRAGGLIVASRRISMINGHDCWRDMGRHTKPAGRWSLPRL